MTTKLNEAALSEDARGMLEALLAAEPWASHFSACVADPITLADEAGRFRDALASLGYPAPVEDVNRALTAAALVLHPDSPAVTQALAAAQAVPAAADAEVDTVPEERWSTEWADKLMKRALRRLTEECPEGADVPDLDAETCELYAASEAEDRPRYSRAVDAWLEAALRGVGAARTASASHPSWDEDWAADEIARAIMFIDSFIQSGVDPEAREEWLEAQAAQTACDAPRFSKALRAVVRASLKELAREGRKLPEPAIEPTHTPGESVSTTKPDPPDNPGGSAWGARTSYRNQRIKS